MKDAGGPLFGDFGANVPAHHGAAVPERREAVHLRSRREGQIGIKLNDDATKKVLDYWAGLVKKGLVGKQDQFTPEYIAGVIDGEYATYISAAWAPGYLQGAGVGKGADAACGRGPAAAVGPGQPGLGELGGSAFSVTSQAKDKALAAKVAFGVYADEESLKDGWKNQIIFPLNVNVLNDPEFVDAEGRVLRGQQANKEVYVPAANAYQGMTYTPIGQYFYVGIHEADRRDQRRVRRPGPRPRTRCKRSREVRERARVHCQVT